MGKIYDCIDDKLAAWLGQQKMFFVATAPLLADGLVNCSPKGMDTFRILGPNEVAYLDLTGSGIETAAHLRENGRIVFMFCAFAGPPMIVRLHGGGVITPQHDDFSNLCRLFPEHPGIRAVVKAQLTRGSDSCGYSVPRYEYLEDRDMLDRWADSQGSEGLATYRRKKNSRSLDDLPGI